MINENLRIVAGVLGKDAELVKTKAGDMIKLSIATSKKNKGGEYETTWHNAVLWGKAAETALLWKKGNNVYVEGSHAENEYTNRDGQKVRSNSVYGFKAFRIDQPRKEEREAFASSHSESENKMPDFGFKKDDTFDDLPF